ncbi:Transmembrane amino acid transporter [Tolypocladium paradoxum]|uniref:Transmembrane amino acid transporter n=1 Tax=Tolypocladium paradoxum TaxID=94208 RepID=A0A2S4LAU0_9HYPO|nr:Transmembrane amino acid transporter [Tolypocladium paradoxum]
MRQPMDFWKALLCGSTFICCIYMFFGMFVYSFQGQFSFNPVMQGLSPNNFQTAANIMNIVTGLIAAALYGNIGFKVIYIEVLQEIFNFSPLTKRNGKIAWGVMMPLYWALAFFIAAAVPQFTYVSGLISAFFVLSFTYTLPALMAVGFWVKKDAMTAEERFDPRTRKYNYVDTGLARWTRGFTKRPIFHTFNLIYMLGSLVTTGLGVYSSVPQY